MAGDDPALVVRVAANISALQADMAAAAATLKQIEVATVEANAATAGWMSSLDGLGGSWVARIAEGQLLRDAVREVISAMKDLAEYLPDLARQGAISGDVEEAFARLTAQAGLLGDALVTTLRAGTHGTIDDFELMKRANEDLAAGLVLTDGQFGLLAQGAFALAKATGGDVKTALDAMNDAMLTGRTRALALLTGKIDLKAAEEAFATSLGGTVANLTTEGKMEADRTAILGAVQAAVGRLGEQTDNLNDKVIQGRIAWENFEDDLGQALAKSVVLGAGLTTLQATFAAAFGGDQTALITAIVEKVQSLAVIVVDFGLAAVEGARVFHVAWSGVQVIVLGVETGLASLAAVAASTYAAIASGAAALPGASAATRELATSAHATADSMWALQKGLNAETDAAIAGVAGHSEFDRTLDKLGGVLFQTRAAMLAATSAHVAAVKPLQDVGEAASHTGALLQQSAAFIKHWAELVADVESAGEGWQGTLDSIDGAVVENMRSLHEAGVSVQKLAEYYGLTTTQGDAFTKMLTSEAAALKVTVAGIEEATKLWDDYDEQVAKASGTAVDQQIAAVDKWGSDLEAKLWKELGNTQAYYTAIDALAADWSAKLHGLAIDEAALTKTASTESQAGLQQIADKAQATYLEAAKHVGEWKDSTIQAYRDTATAAQQAANEFGMDFGTVLDTVKAKADATTAAITGISAAMSIAGSHAASPEEQHAWETSYAGITQNILNAAQVGQDNTRNNRTRNTSVGAQTRPLQMDQGGMGDFGSGTPAILHGKEAVVPLDKAGAGGFGGTTNTFHITVTGATGADHAALLDRLKKMLIDTLPGRRA